MKVRIAIISFFLFASTCLSFYDSQQWLGLLYYEKTPKGYVSLANSEQFFITKHGKTKPKKEYEASLKLVIAQDENFKRKFPLRYKILAQKNAISYEPIVNVKSDLNSAFLVFPNRYMGNPASMFGHLFITLQSDKGLYQSDIIHFIADASSATMFNYVTSGLSGGFKGSFVTDVYYKKLKEYTYSDDRDVYFYDLNISKEVVHDMQLHAIELKNTTFDYFFLEKNCAYFIARFLNNVMQSQIRMNDFVVLPSDIINSLIKNKVIQSSYFRPSSTNVFSNSYQLLSFKEKKYVKHLMFNKQGTNNYSDNVYKSFLDISYYGINNFTNYAEVIRYNRILAYKQLNKTNISYGRIDYIDQDSIKKILSKSAQLSYSSYYGYVGVIKLISFGNFEEFLSLHVKNISVLYPSFYINKKNKLNASFTTVDVENTVPFDRILTNKSWEIKQQFIFDSEIYQDMYFSYAYAFPLVKDLLFSSGFGASLSSYNTYENMPFKHLKLQPYFSTKLGYLNPFGFKSVVSSVSFTSKYSSIYLDAGLKVNFNSNKIITSKLSLINNAIYSSFSLTTLF